MNICIYWCTFSTICWLSFLSIGHFRWCSKPDILLPSVNLSNLVWRIFIFLSQKFEVEHMTEVFKKRSGFLKRSVWRKWSSHFSTAIKELSSCKSSVAAVDTSFTLITNSLVICATWIVRLRMPTIPVAKVNRSIITISKHTTRSLHDYHDSWICPGPWRKIEQYAASRSSEVELSSHVRNDGTL